MRRFFEAGHQRVPDGSVNTADIDRALALRDGPTGEAIHVLVDCKA